MSNTQGAATKVVSGVAQAGVSDTKVPRTDRGRRTLRKLLDAAAEEFGEKGFHEASVSSITRRAGIALGSFYTYFDSKDALFRALVGDMSEKVRTSARSALSDGMGPLEIERAALAAFLRFAAEHKEIYRIMTKRSSSIRRATASTMKPSPRASLTVSGRGRTRANFVTGWANLKPGRLWA